MKKLNKIPKREKSSNKKEKRMVNALRKIKIFKNSNEKLK